MKNIIIAVLTAILLTIISYYCYVYYYKKETFQSDKYKLPIDNSKLTKEMFPNYQPNIKPKNDKNIIVGFFDKNYPLNGSESLEKMRYGSWNDDGLKDRILKNPEKITILFNDYKSYFYQLVDDETYHNSNIDVIIESLLLSYNDIYKNTSLVDNNMKSLFKIMNTGDSSIASESYYDDIEKIASPECLEILENITDSDDNKFVYGDIVWFYSFWVRRYNEGNLNQTIAIIREANEHYNPDSEESAE